jgi:hypothetical protein
MALMILYKNVPLEFNFKENVSSKEVSSFKIASEL